MSEQKYMYWHPGQPKPEKMPEGCEVNTTPNTWNSENAIPAVWCCAARRWPVSEHVWRAHHYCEAYGITVPEGYEVIGFRVPDPHELYLERNGKAIASFGDGCAAYPILRKIEQPTRYRTPTDEDAKLRPQVEVRNCHDDKWHRITLVAVRDTDWPYLAIDGSQWKKCRMEVKS